MKLEAKILSLVFYFLIRDPTRVKAPSRQAFHKHSRCETSIYDDVPVRIPKAREGSQGANVMVKMEVVGLSTQKRCQEGRKKDVEYDLELK